MSSEAYDWNTRLTRSMKCVHDGIMTYTRGVAGIVHDTRVLQGGHHKYVKFSPCVRLKHEHQTCSWLTINPPKTKASKLTGQYAGYRHKIILHLQIKNFLFCHS